MDAEAARLLVGKNADPEFPVRVGSQVNGGCASVVLDPPSGLNVVMFKAGLGDGAYASYWGLDAGGEPACLVTDFGVLYPPEDGEQVEG
jgi:uncharacterized protein DUF4241